MLIPELSLEKSLRKKPYLSGTWLLLGNGETWCVSSCPLGKRGEAALAHLTSLDKVRKKVLELPDEEGARKMMEATFSLCLFALQLNYPALTREKTEEEDLLQVAHGPLIVQILQGNFEPGETLGSPSQENLGK